MNEHEYRNKITLDDFISIVIESQHVVFLERVFRQQLVAADFGSFRCKVIELFENIERSVPFTMGKNAAYIPQLEKVDGSLFAISGLQEFKLSLYD